jgi:hypothetical protein
MMGGFAMNKKVNGMIEELQQVRLDLIKDKACCGALEAYRKSGFEWPFYKPIMIETKTGQLKTSGWHINIMPSLSSGKPDSQNRILIRLEYCPFCGLKLIHYGPDEVEPIE